MNELGISILLKTYEHLKLCFFALFLAMILAIPLGIFLARTPFKRIALWIMRFIAILQTIPGIALIALMVVFLYF